ncbi:hypothetical protein F6Y05_19990 [Bacillus megaterium]|nr:hypothetical protein [Priestia megaterium]
MNTAHMMLTIVIGGFIAFLLGFGVTKIIELAANSFSSLNSSSYRKTQVTPFYVRTELPVLF